MDPPKNQFLNSLARALVFFGMKRYWSEKFFDMVWGYQPPESPKWILKSQFFNGVSLDASFFLYISSYVTEKYLDVVWGYLLPRNLEKSVWWTA